MYILCTGVSWCSRLQGTSRTDSTGLLRWERTEVIGTLKKKKNVKNYSSVPGACAGKHVRMHLMGCRRKHTKRTDKRMPWKSRMRMQDIMYVGTYRTSWYNLLEKSFKKKRSTRRMCKRYVRKPYRDEWYKSFKKIEKIIC